ncbi:carboxylesterase 4A-like [Neocloeon triangulifer]|uniref:carboxylesterase 4A-like n=1 Tax=Neocloeon triangulifer TaxID=2078957 RepID=UPI00286F461A|nr:carboxylesterase 4A-like [Neocloeon triangulifer]
MAWHNFLVFLFFCSSFVIDSFGQEPVVMLKQGAVKGLRTYTETRIAINSFLGIPYVEPPLGRLRFSSPERHKGWNSTLEAYDFKPACPQILPPVSDAPSLAFPPNTSEDCLFINVWAPDAQNSGLRNYPVVVLFEGDEFVSGWPGRFPGLDLAAEGLVVVSASYRLNVFGFFYLGIKEARGNYGLLDQYLALLWVRENVAAFGGDPSSVTLLGHGAGAASALMHATSPRTTGLFHRIIAMSGTPLASWAGGQKGAASAMAASREIAKSLGCLRQNALSAMNCLRKLPADDLLQAFKKLYNGGNWSEIPLPVSDSFLPENDRYLPDDARKALTKVTVPVLLGVTSSDGIAALASINNLPQRGYQELLQFAEQVTIPGLISQMALEKKQILVKEIVRHHYLSRARDGDAEALLSQIIKLYSDAMYHAPVHETANILAQNINSPPVYVYHLENLYSIPGSDFFHQTGINSSGASYGTDLIIFMGQSILAKVLGRRWTVAEERLLIAIRRFWLNFVRQGNPTPSVYGYNSVTWRPYSPAEGNFFNLENQQMRVEPLPREGISLWNNLLPKIDSLQLETSTEKQGVPIMQGNSMSYTSTTLVLGVLSLVLGVLLVTSLLVMKRRYGRYQDNAEDAF